MQYDVTSPAAYLSELDDDWRRRTLEQLRDLILASAPDLKERIHYRMLCYSSDRGNLFHLNAQKHYVSLYVGDAEKIDPDGSLLSGLDVGKGCIRFRKSVSVDETRIAGFIDKAIALSRQGLDLGC